MASLAQGVEALKQAAHKLQKKENNAENYSKNIEKIDNNANLKVEIANNLVEKAEQKATISGEILLGEMLKILRNDKNNKLLVIFREIENLNIDGDYVTVVADSKVLDLLESGEANDYLKNFLKSKGFKLKIQDDDINDAIEKLNELLGGKLKID